MKGILLSIISRKAKIVMNGNFKQTNLFRANSVWKWYLIIISVLVANCHNRVSHDTELIFLGGQVGNYAVYRNDTIYSGGWDTSIKPLQTTGDTVVYDCGHLFKSYYWRWCGDSLFELDTNVTLQEVNKRIDFYDSNFWCLDNFHIVTLRTDTTFQLKSKFNRGDTVFHQSAYTKLNDYWSIE